VCPVSPPGGGAVPRNQGVRMSNHTPHHTSDRMSNLNVVKELARC
jgi:hypothetical protein